MLSSVVKIKSKKVEPDYFNIWNPGKRADTSGSGFGVEIKGKKYIMTNAHVAEFSHYIECKKYNSDKMFPLEIFDIAYGIDLALLFPKENHEEFWKDIPICQIVLPPPRGFTIKVVGFPQGGSNPSITKGVISRIIPKAYNKCIMNLATQVDAAINPGNSGGPVFNDKNQIVGIAFSHSAQSQNLCYIIPSFILNYYVESIIRFKKFPGVCDLEIDELPMENESTREYYLGKNDNPGILISKVKPTGSVGHLLKSGDILHKIDNIVIGRDGTVLME